jgi:hypothetical protein
MSFVARIIAFHQQHKILSHIGFWIAALFLTTMTESYQASDVWFSPNRLLFHAVTLITQIITAYFLAYFVIPGFMESRAPIRMSVYAITGMYLICAIARLLNLHVYEPLAQIPPKAFENLHEVFTNVGRLFYVYFFRNLSVAIAFLFLKLLTDQHEAQQKALKLEKEKSAAELKLLKAQLNPHFLFNTLNNIYSLSFTGSPATSQSIARLSEILDHILYRCNEALAPLDEEIDLIHNYIELEKLRYGDRITVNISLADTRGISVPPLVLLSLVENAFKHGASEDTGTPVITITMNTDDKNLRFMIGNTMGEYTREASKGIGLPNLKRQLEFIYQQDYLLAIKKSANWFEVVLTLPK